MKPNDPSSRPSSGRIPTAAEIAGKSDTTSEPRLRTRSSGTHQAARAPEPVRIVYGEAPVEAAVVSITSRPHEDVLEYTHAFVLSYIKRRWLSRAVEPVSVATYELLSNALNYGSLSTEIVLQLHEGPGVVSVRVTNNTMQTRIDMLCAQLDRLIKNPEATFLEEMRRSVGGGVGRPALGLARIVHEAKLDLEAYIVGQRVTLIGAHRGQLL